VKDNVLEQLLHSRPKMGDQPDAAFTQGTLRKIRLQQNAQAPKKEFWFMNFKQPFKMLKGVPLGIVAAFAVTATASAAIAGYMWHQSSVQQLDTNNNVVSFQATGCPNFYQLQNNPQALEQANLSQVKRFVLRPDIKNIPDEQKQKTAQAYCEINQLKAYAQTSWPNSAQEFNDVVLPIKVVTISGDTVTGQVLGGDNTEQAASFVFQPNTLWFKDGTRIDKNSIKPGDTLSVVNRRATEQGSQQHNHALAFVQLPLEFSYYTAKTQSTLLPVDQCENNPGEDCINTNSAIADLYDKSKDPGYVVPAKSQRLQAKVVGIQGTIYSLVSKGGKQFSLNLGNYKVQLDLTVEMGDYLDIRYDAAKGLSQDSIYAMNLLVYSTGGKFSSFDKFRN
jgi:hypothetical protein